MPELQHRMRDPAAQSVSDWLQTLPCSFRGDSAEQATEAAHAAYRDTDGALPLDEFWRELHRAGHRCEQRLDRDRGAYVYILALPRRQLDHDNGCAGAYVTDFADC